MATAALLALPNIRVLTRCTVFGVYDGGTYGAVERVTDHLAAPDIGPAAAAQLEDRGENAASLATGAIERPMVFGNNDLPGVMLAGAVRSYINRYAVAPGRRAVLFANHDGIRGTHHPGAGQGRHCPRRRDRRSTPGNPGGDAGDLATPAGAAVFAGAGSGAALGKRLASPGSKSSPAAGTLTRLRCDLLAMSGGWNPTMQLTSCIWAASRYGTRGGAPSSAGQAATRPMSVTGRAAGALASTQLIGSLSGGRTSVRQGLYRFPERRHGERHRKLAKQRGFRPRSST